jgi:hypothetical protein
VNSIVNKGEKTAQKQYITMLLGCFILRNIGDKQKGPTLELQKRASSFSGRFYYKYNIHGDRNYSSFVSNQQGDGGQQNISNDRQ